MTNVATDWTWYDFVTGGVFLVWTVATILRHLPTDLLPRPIQRLVDNGALAWLIPSWNFFAPTPGTHTYTLLYRDLIGEGVFTEWRELRQRRSYSFMRLFWNPGKTLSKALVDISLEMVRTVAASQAEPALVRVSIPYLSVLNLVSQQPHLADAVAVQFMILQQDQDRRGQVLHLSGIHRF